ncbi:HlyD family secretion protein [Flavobacterium lindanitolerans]|jgi:multidrug resistance efflux pump|uniref:HlyD family secretion protein n=1 Tax=Flavobacterium lindanitolerans TaxID=428988 RepID=A0A497V9Y0_9FLAO|nr:HlyD family secretion protein [Flavobacterium lindanitolerans]MDQ7959704.1 HlyD family efflux transporter periplasmic adaptor subunit [Flavobacterium lindanitolerans]PKW29480.1 HlyD family secretion protein [Flavobacterium lindanitolerans]RLJ35019.1 HlyD family secretion protein [Flavobacterium lindanitolerans]THD31637.1 MAG: HlyD family efflux transporter periplasmic adaptor subunit [Flavobacterium johnsoniae]
MPDDKHIELRSEEVQEILTKVPHWMIRWGNVVILTVLLSLLVMSWVVKYPDIVTSEITITTQIPPQRLITKSSGRIEKIFIKNGETVSANTALAVIENTARYQDVFLLKSIIDTLKIDKSFIRFPFESLPSMQLGEIEGPFAVFEKDFIAYSLNRKLQPYKVEGAAQNYEVIEIKERLNLLQQQKQISETEIQLKKKELDRYKKLYDKGIISTQEWETKNLDYLQTEKNLRGLSSSISQMKSSLNDLNKNSKSTKINETKDDVSLFRNAIQSYNQLKKAIADWELAYVLRSSISGEVSFMQVWTENQTITAGDNVFSIIPKESDNYIGKIKAKAQNSGKIKIGQNVNIRLANYPDREFGVIRGKIQSISLTPDKEGNILIDVSLPNKLETSYHKKIAFRQEMSGTADIITQDLRLMERLLYQFRDLFRRT